MKNNPAAFLTSNIFISKKTRLQREKEYKLMAYGINIEKLESASENSVFHIVDRIFERLAVCIIRAVLIFLAVTGTIGSLASAFNLPYTPVIYIFIFTISFIIAFIYYNRLCFYLGYGLFFIIFSLTAIYSYFVINSGFQAITNIIFEKYSDYFALNSIREATEYVDNRMLTVSFALVFLGTFLAILLNIAISGYMNLIETFLITFPIVEIALYIDMQPNIIYLVMLFVVYITVGILNRSEHFQLSSIKRAKDEFISYRKKKNGVIRHSYISNGRGMLYVAAQSFVFMALFLIVTSGIFYSSYDSRLITNQLKATTDEYIKTFVQSGAFSFFDRYKSTGGLGSGRLGGVGRVTPDYNTDLIATFVPVDASTIYLKGFIGNKYSKNVFAPDEELLNFSAAGAYNPSSEFSFSEYTHPTGNLAKMQIENIDVPGTDLLPYDSIAYKYKDHNYISHLIYDYSALDNILDDTNDMLNDELDYTDYDNKILDVIYDPYMPYANHNYYEKSPYIDEKYENFVYENYLNVPEELKETLDDICYEADLSLIKLPEDTNEYRLEILRRLKSFYLNEFSYTMAPGVTPRNEDSVEYFLTKRRRGFCAHFASSATLLLRNMGIPTRYVEGYAIHFSSIADDGVLVTEDTNLWLNEDFNFYYEGTEANGVVSVEVTDGSAHAWVEVYIDGYGWIPYEFTPPSTEDIVTNFNFRNLFAGLMRVGADTANSSNNLNNGIANADANTDGSKFNYNFGKAFGFLAIPFICVLTATIIAIIFFFLSGKIVRQYKIHRYAKASLYSDALAIAFIDLTYLLKNSKDKDFTHFSVRDYEEYMIKNYYELVKTDDINYLIKAVNQALYSKTEITLEVYEKCSLILEEIRAAHKAYIKNSRKRKSRKKIK